MPKTEKTEKRSNAQQADGGEAAFSPQVAELLQTLAGAACAAQEKAQYLAEVRRRSPEIGQQLDAYFWGRIDSLHHGLTTARQEQQELKSVLDQLMAPPLFPAVYLGATRLTSPQQPAGQKPIEVAGAVVQHGSSRRHVALMLGLQEQSLQIGDEVLLNADLSAVIAKSPCPPPPYGDKAVVDQVLDGNRLLIRAGGEERVIGVAAALRAEPWRSGDAVRWDRSAALAFERLARDEGREFLLESVEDLPLGQVGGLSPVRDELISVLTLALSAAEIARRYGLDGQRTILLEGPPGVGKTMLAKIAAAEIQRRLGRPCSILVVKPGQFEDPYVGVTQQRIRECFAALRQADGFGLLFLDEVESIGRARGSGGSVGFHSDKFLAALLAEIQGFQSSRAEGQPPTALIAATNRIDMLDPALVERMQVRLRIPRPDLRAAREIFDIHLPPELPYSPNGEQAGHTRRQMIERAISLLYGPNAAAALCTVRFRDNTQRVISARELASGRCIEHISRCARQTAAYREVHGGEAGLRLSDIEQAVAETVENLAASLTRGSIHQYLSDLRQEVDVVAVEPIVRRVSRPHRFINDHQAAA